MKYLLLILPVIVIFSSCKKTKITSVNTNNSVDSLTYQPSVAGSKWTYQLIVSGIPTSTYNTTCTEKDSVINAKTYKVFNSDNDGLQFFRRNGDEYYTVLTTSTNKTELLVLDASKNINDTWVGGVNGSDTYTYTLTEKHPTFALDGFNFKNVLVVHQVRKDGGGNTTLEADTWYAQGIGQIKSEGTLLGNSLVAKLIAVELK
ncbi:MAG: hypothetical protein R2831_07660 [Chitinophagaceae bacterium]